MKRLAIAFATLLTTVAANAQETLQPGTYYIQNKAAGTYLSSGATWGTRAVLSPHGIDVKVTVSNGAYTLTTQIQGAAKALRPSDGYMDQSGTWTVTPLDDGSYALFNGTNYFGYDATNAHPWVPRIDTFTDTDDEATHWLFRSREELAATLSEATKDQPVDATFLIAAPDFLTGDYRITGSHVWGQELSAIGGNISGSSYLRNNANAEKFNTAKYDITQTLHDIPNGIYSLSVQGFYRYGSISAAASAFNASTEQLLPVLYAGSKSTPLHSIFSEAQRAATGGWTTTSNAGFIPNSQNDAAQCFDDGAYVTTLTDIVVTDGTLTIGIRKDNKTVTNDWACFDNFTLLYHGADLTLMRESALKTLEEYATLNTDSDEQYAEALETLRNVIIAAETATEIEQAVSGIKDEYNIYRSKATPTDTAIDLTSLLANANYNAGTAGWDAVTVNNEGYSQVWTPSSDTSPIVLEAYAGYTNHELIAYSLTQPVMLAPGMYRLKANAFYRFGTSYNSDITNDGVPHSYAWLVAGEDSTLIMRLADEAANSYPNTMAEAATAFSKGQYLNSVIFTLDEPTRITLGFRGQHTRYRSWFIAGPVMLEKISEEVLEKEGEKDFSAQKKLYEKHWNTLLTITNQALDHSAFDETLQLARTTLETVTTQEELDSIDGTLWQALRNTLTTQTTATGQFDLTSLIQNAAMSTNISGWTTEGTFVWESTGMAEAYNVSSAKISQTLPVLPAGNYTMKVQAFYRPTTYGTSSRSYEAGTEENKGEMFLNTQAQAIKSINDDARYVPAAPASDVAGAFGKCIPNSLNGANAAFRSGQYWNVLRAQMAEDGPVTIGLRFQDALSSCWMAFDNFKLYYGAPTVSVALSENSTYDVKEDTYADVTTDITLKAGRLNTLCLPFDMPATAFEEVLTVAKIEYNATDKTVKAVLTPTNGVQAGQPYFVRVAEDMRVSAQDVLLRAVKPDSLPVMVDGGGMQGYYGRTTLRRLYYLDESDTLSFTTLRGNMPGYRAALFTPVMATRPKVMATEDIDFMQADYTLNLENSQARDFLSTAKYTTSAAATVISKYNSCPPARRDQPATARIPLNFKTFGSTADIVFTYVETDEQENADGSKVLAPHTLQLKPTDTYCEVKNLIPQKTYEYQVKSNGTVVGQGHIATDGRLRMIKVPTVSNVRDLGGWLNADGNRLRYGFIFRGGEMNAGHVMNDADREELRRLGIGAELDLREDIDFGNTIISTSALGTDIPYLYVNQHMFGDDALQQDTAKYHAAFNFVLSNLRAGRSVYFHCIWGADRTGATAMLLEGLLGLPLDQLYKDYELTTFSIAGLRQKSGLDSKLNYLNTLPGNTLQKRFYHYWHNIIGISDADLCDFINIMVDGESTITAISDLLDGRDGTGNNGSHAANGKPAYFSTDGIRLSAPRRGLNIIRMPDGTTRKFHHN